MTAILDVISRVGFPIFVGVWLLVRTDALLIQLRDTLMALTAELRSVRTEERGNRGRQER